MACNNSAMMRHRCNGFVWSLSKAKWINTFAVACGHDCGLCSKLQRPDGASDQTAAQMWCLIRHLPLLIGDKFFEDNHMLLECMDFIFWSELRIGHTYFLKQLIGHHHKHFLTLYPERHLKPEHHFMTHYPHQKRLLGPLIWYWTPWSTDLILNSEVWG